MADNTDTVDEPLSNSIDTGSESPSGENIASNQEMNNMDTHAHHLHHAPGKKFWHYFYEFLMQLYFLN